MWLSHLSGITPAVKRIAVSTIMALAIAFFCISNVNAAIINATSCSQADVQSAINAASNGDTVVVPSETCTWSSGVTINGKSITVQGGGIGVTTINASATAFTLTGLQSSRITGFTFNVIGGNGIRIAGGTNWRIDHNKFSSSTARSFMVDAVSPGLAYFPYGLFDNNQFIGMWVVNFGRGHKEWYEETNLGSVETVYFEDNTFTGPADSSEWLVADANYGGRVVFRYNKITVPSQSPTTYSGNFQWHSLQGDGNVRGSRKFEVYGNVWESFKSGGSAVAAYLRAGTGVFFNNSFINYGSTAMLLDNVRSYEARGSYGQCNGSATGNVDGNESGKYGYSCRDQIGRGKDASLFIFGSTPYPSQALEPIYQLNNYRYTTRANYEQGSAYGTVVNFYIGNAGYSRIHIVENRDFYNGTQRPGYTPLTYPHPLRQAEGDASTSAPLPPRNLKIVN